MFSPARFCGFIFAALEQRMCSQPAVAQQDRAFFLKFANAPRPLPITKAVAQSFSV
jgi:hypothetical protein